MTAAVFEHARAAQWSAQAVSTLCAAAYEEDVWGGVQHSVPTVLVSLLNCIAAVERYQAQVLPPSRRGRGEDGALLLVSATAAELERSIMRMLVYKPHLRSMRLPPSAARRLRGFAAAVE